MEITEFQYHEVNEEFMEEVKPTVSEEVMALVRKKYETAQYVKCTLYFLMCKYDDSPVFSYQIIPPEIEENAISMEELLKLMMEKSIQAQIKEVQDAARDQTFPY